MKSEKRINTKFLVVVIIQQFTNPFCSNTRNVRFSIKVRFKKFIQERFLRKKSSEIGWLSHCLEIYSLNVVDTLNMFIVIQLQLAPTPSI